MSIHFLKKYGWEMVSSGLWLDPKTKDIHYTRDAVEIQSKRLANHK